MHVNVKNGLKEMTESNVLDRFLKQIALIFMKKELWQGEEHLPTAYTHTHMHLHSKIKSAFYVLYYIEKD